MATAVVEERELLKALSWYDGFVVALANPSFLLTALGGSVVALGGGGATLLWLVSVLVGALHTNIYAELAAMFPKAPGGIAIYAHEAWKRYLSIIGPISAFGYWLSWSVVLALNGAIVGFLVQAQFFPHSTFGTFHKDVGCGIVFDASPAIWIAAAVILLIWAANAFGVQSAKWMGYVTGALLLIPLGVVIVLPFATGAFKLSNLTSSIDLGSLGDKGWRLVITWLYLMCWSSYTFECCASFAPEYHDAQRDTTKALRSAALFSLLTFGLFPLAAIGAFGDKKINLDNALTFYAPLFEQLGGKRVADVLVILLCAGLVLSMNTATLDGSRALYGISRDGMTIRWLGKLNKYAVPGNAMTLDTGINIFLLFTEIGTLSGGGYLKVLAISNLGYVLSHIFATSGFLLLRKDRPAWPRPIKLARGWVVVAWICLLFDTVLLAVGSVSFDVTGYVGGMAIFWSGIGVLGTALVLYVYRTIVEDKQPLLMRLSAPTMPEEPAAAEIPEALRAGDVPAAPRP